MIKINSKKGLWISGLIIIALSFVGVNFYLSWLKTMITPFASEIDLSESNSSFTHNIEGFYSEKYVMGIDFKRNSETEKMKWSDLEAKIRQDFDIIIQISIRDEEGNDVLSHKGDLKKWTLTNSHILPTNNMMLYCNSRFAAKLNSKYILKIDVIEGSPLVQEYKPNLAFTGIDDGYFWLLRPMYNILLGVFFIVVIGCIYLAFFLKRKYIGKNPLTSP